MKNKYIFILIIAGLIFSGCTASPDQPINDQTDELTVLASTSILADIAQNVAGDRARVDSLLPVGVDPHAYQPRPADAAKVAKSSVLILNGADYEHFMEPILENAGGDRLVIEASTGLTPRSVTEVGHPAGDPHFWLNPNLVITYVKNIRDGLIEADPDGAAAYQANADAYIKKLQDLDAWIKTQVDTLTPEKRYLVTNHESLGYFADRYGFTVVGAVIPSLSSEASPSAQEMAALVEKIRSSNAMVIFLDTMDNPDLAKQIAKEARIKVVTDLHLESLTPSNGFAPTYIDMMKLNTETIVKGCKG